MKVTLLGTGDALHGGGRGHSSLLVEDDAGRLLIDCGATTPLALSKLGLGQRDLDAILITHLHGDHFAGTSFLLLDALYGQGRERPLIIAGPPGTEAHVEAMLALHYASAASKPRSFLTDYRVLEPGQALALGGRRVIPFAARHMSSGTALCLRLESGGKVLAVSGDTAATDTLERLSAGADLFVCECTLSTPDPKVLHLSVPEVEALRPSWQTPKVVLTHLSAEARAAATGSEGLLVGDDGDCFTL